MALACSQPMFETRSCNLQTVQLIAVLRGSSTSCRGANIVGGNCEFGANGCGAHVSWSAATVLWRRYACQSAEHQYSPAAWRASCPPLNVTAVQRARLSSRLRHFTGVLMANARRIAGRSAHRVPHSASHPKARRSSMSRTQPDTAAISNHVIMTARFHFGVVGQCSQSCNTGSRTRIRNIIVGR